MNILVIGGAGYIGSHVTRELLDRGHLVTVFDNLSSGLRKNLFPEADFVHGDILRDADLLAAAREKATASRGRAIRRGRRQKAATARSFTLPRSRRRENP
jgi:nucleoside-diphosphate-sugar epimerase